MAIRTPAAPAAAAGSAGPHGAATPRPAHPPPPAARVGVPPRAAPPAGGPRRGQRLVGLLSLALGLPDQRARVLLRVVLRDVVEGGERRHGRLAGLGHLERE